jgi:hypothetical protein
LRGRDLLSATTRSDTLGELVGQFDLSSEVCFCHVVQEQGPI